ncbi:J domain-containing protein [Massilia sp. GCM10023247]|uniref:J domain-containing protein n=1 Tax=Massilia sp. GCM10023247 TaxID=3252643 RepID=UPI003610123B
MAKIHTHYDNLKVARGAPQEVIRAAYKALSQKYHPDKNPGDEKAARIMAIVNTAYNTLSDPLRRKEHDEWIAAEEWEVEWLESTGEEGGRARGEAGWETPAQAPSPRRRLWRDARWWLGIAGGVGLGVAASVLLIQKPRLLPTALAFNGKPGAVEIAATAAPAPAASLEPDIWASAGAEKNPPSPVKTLAVTQLVVPRRQPGCDTDLATRAAPNGEPWPAESGYIPGYPFGNGGREMTVVVDNSANTSPVFVKIYDLDRRANVRHAYVMANGSLTIDELAAGKYEVRYQNIVTGAPRSECAGSDNLRQAEARSGFGG